MLKRTLRRTGWDVGLPLLVTVVLVVVFLQLRYIHSSVKRQRNDAHATESPADPPRETHQDAFDSWLSQDRIALQQELAQLREELSSLRGAGAGYRPQETPSTTAAPSATKPPVLLQGTGSPAPSPALWLTIGIPSVPRRDESVERLPSTLLYQTAMSYLNQMASSEGLAAGITVVICNNRPGSHPVFTAVKRALLQLHGHPYFGQAAQRFVFADDASPGSGGQMMYPDVNTIPAEGEGHELPTPAVRRQSLDVVRMLDFASEHASQYFLFTEDDFVLCPNGLIALQYAIGKARQYLELGNQGPPFSALRCGFGLNGIVLHNSRRYPDAKRFRDYLLKHVARRPPDHLVVEFFAKETQEAKSYFGEQRRPAAFRHNIFLHKGGKKSTLREENAWSMPGCFTELVVPQLFEVEAWNPAVCRHDDIWPCDSPAAEKKVVLRWNNSRETEVSSHWVESHDS